ncbi:MAG: DUF6295 family protein [Roseiflexaceae bacterium]|jgi:hypothetical protein|nr:DUF6295 family protein [Chloroflexaceae bacterium]
MCTMIATQIKVAGSAKGSNGWFTVREVNVSYDHPFEAPFEHALNLDFVNESMGVGARVAVELDVDSARQLVATISEILAKAEAGGYVTPGSRAAH